MEVGYENIALFDKMSRFISETVQDRTIVTMECKWETVPKLLNGVIFDDLELL